MGLTPSATPLLTAEALRRLARCYGSDLPALARLLAAETTTPHHGYAGVWDGYGGLLGFTGEAPSRAVLTFSADPTVGDDESLQDRHRAMLEASTRDPFNNVFRKPTWQPGLLSDEISRGPRLELPQRSYLLFSAGATAFTDASWPDLAPWVSPDEARAWAQTPKYGPRPAASARSSNSATWLLAAARKWCMVFRSVWNQV